MHRLSPLFECNQASRLLCGQNSARLDERLDTWRAAILQAAQEDLMTLGLNEFRVFGQNTARSCQHV